MNHAPGRRDAVLAFIRRLTPVLGGRPGCRQIARALGMNSTTVSNVVRTLLTEGVISARPARSSGKRDRDELTDERVPSGLKCDGKVLQLPYETLGVRERDLLDLVRTQSTRSPDGVCLCELARAMAISVKRVHRYACRLMVAGWLMRTGGKLTTLRVLAVPPVEVPQAESRHREPILSKSGKRTQPARRAS